MIPSKPFSHAASQITGLHIFQGDLYLYENPVAAVSAKIACQQLLQYSQSYRCRVILVAHNGFSFDNPRLIRLMKQCELYQEFCDSVQGFADTLPIFKSILQAIKKKKKKFSIASLLQDYILDYKTQSLHNAVEDINCLKKLIHSIIKTVDDLKKYAKSIVHLEKEKELKLITNLNKSSLIDLKNTLSSNIINKMSINGIS